jgi:hypothetical protein
VSSLRRYLGITIICSQKLSMIKKLPQVASTSK